jgi:hypothetical protein
VVLLIFVWYAQGVGEEEGPLNTLQIVDRLTALNIPTPWDDKPQSNKKYGYGRWNRSSIYKILHQSAYNGTFYHYRYHMVGGVKQFNHNQEDWIGVPVPRIVDEELFKAAQLKLTQGRSLSSRGAQYEYLFGRRVYCECGYKIRAKTSHKPHRVKDGVVKDYSYHFYVCPGRRGGRVVVNHCDMPPIRIDKLDARVWQWVKEEIANPEILERKLKEIQEGQRKGQLGLTEKIETLKAHQEEIEDELKKLGKLYTTDMPKHIIEALISEQSTKLKLVADEIRKLETEQETPLTDDTITTLVGLSWQLSEHLAAMEDRFEAKRVVVDGLDVKVKVTRKNGEIWLELTSILRPDVVSSILFQR